MEFRAPQGQGLPWSAECSWHWVEGLTDIIVLSVTQALETQLILHWNQQSPSPPLLNRLALPSSQFSEWSHHPTITQVRNLADSSLPCSQPMNHMALPLYCLYPHSHHSGPSPHHLALGWHQNFLTGLLIPSTNLLQQWQKDLLIILTCFYEFLKWFPVVFHFLWIKSQLLSMA